MLTEVTFIAALAFCAGALLVLALSLLLNVKEGSRSSLAVCTQEFQTLFEKSPDTIARYNLEYQLIYANPAFRRLQGTTTQFLTERQSWNYYGTEYTERLRDVFESGRDDEFECTWMAATGNTITSQILLISEQDVDGKVTGVWSIGRDITTLKENELYLRDSRTLLRELTARREIEVAQTRKELARKMHEDYGQMLAMLRMKLALLSMRFGKDLLYLRQEAEEALILLDETISCMRDMVSSMRPSALNIGIAPALEWLAERNLSATTIQYVVYTDSSVEKLDEASASHLFNIVQIALSNILLHAEAEHVAIKCEAHGDGYRLEISDDGKGFDLNRPRMDSMGMVAMEELSNMLAGEIVFLSEPGKGTVIEVCFPGKKEIALAISEAV